VRSHFSLLVLSSTLPNNALLGFDEGLTLSPQGGAPASALLWPGLTNVAGGKSLVKFVVSYCGIVSAHSHPDAAEWNTVISGTGQVSYYRLNTGSSPRLVMINVQKVDTFVFPKGSGHWWANYSPTEQLATIGGFSAAFRTPRCRQASSVRQRRFFPLCRKLSWLCASKATSGGNLFPLLPSRQPANCGGDVPCTSCE